MKSESILNYEEYLPFELPIMTLLGSSTSVSSDKGLCPIVR